MKELVLLGAGASKEAGIPMAFELTVKLLKLAAEGTHQGSFHVKPDIPKSVFLRRVVGMLALSSPAKSTGVNFENLINALTLLRDRAYGSMWPLQDLSNDEIKELFDTNPASSALVTEAEAAGTAIETGTPPSPIGLKPGPMERPNSYNIHYLIQWINESIAEHFLWVNNRSRVQYLRPLANYAKANGVVIATLNYDNTVELAAEQDNIKLSTGIEIWQKTGRYPTIADGCRLLHLHGSLTWGWQWDGSKEGDTITKTFVNAKRRVLADSEGQAWWEPAIIVGGHNKLTADGPFPGMFSAFENALMRTERLTVIGYAFADDHINAILSKWFCSHPAAIIRVINGPSFDDKSLPVEIYQQVINDKAPQRFKNTLLYASEGIKVCFEGQLISKP